MNNKKILAAIMASLMVCGTFASCSSGSSSETKDSSEAETTTEAPTEADTPVPTAAVDDAEVEDSIACSVRRSLSCYK